MLTVRATTAADAGAVAALLARTADRIAALDPALASTPVNPIGSRVWPRLGWRPVWSAWERRS